MTAHESLTPRQLEIFLLRGHNHPAKEIARMLNISYHTVRMHIFMIHERTGLRTCGEIVQYVTRMEVRNG